MKENLAVLIAILVSLPALALAADMPQPSNPCDGVTLASLREQVPIPPARILSKKAVSGMCEVILDLRGQYVPVYAGPDYVIAGQMFRDGRAITRAEIDRLKAKRFVSLKDEVEKCVAMTLKPQGKAPRRTVYMFTDPVCPFCHRAETHLRQIADKYAVQFKMLFYSVHPPVGTEKAIEAVCRKLTAGSYLEGKWKKKGSTDKYQCKEGQDLIRRTEQLVRKLGIRGVPMFYLSDGTLVSGANIPALEAELRKPVKISSVASER